MTYKIPGCITMLWEGEIMDGYDNSMTMGTGNTDNKPVITNNAGGMYNDAQMQHVRPEHDFRRRISQEKANCCTECYCQARTAEA